jgi:hypothetical protein
VFEKKKKKKKKKKKEKNEERKRNRYGLRRPSARTSLSASWASPPSCRGR